MTGTQNRPLGWASLPKGTPTLPFRVPSPEASRRTAHTAHRSQTAHKVNTKQFDFMMRNNSTRKTRQKATKPKKKPKAEPQQKQPERVRVREHSRRPENPKKRNKPRTHAPKNSPGQNARDKLAIKLRRREDARKKHSLGCYVRQSRSHPCFRRAGRVSGGE